MPDGGISEIAAVLSALAPSAVAGSATAGAISTFGITSLAAADAIFGGVYAATSIAYGLALSAAASGMRGSSGGVQTREERNPLASRRIIWGKAWTAGAGLPEITWGPSNKYLEKIIVLADHPCDGFEQLYVDGYPATLGTYDSVKGYPILYTSDPTTGNIAKDFRVGQQKFWIMFHWGADGQTADQWLVNNIGPGANYAVDRNKWASTKVGTNVSYARVTAYYDSDIFSGIPQFNFFIRGILLYDPTKDTTVGGSGSHRWGTPSTYEWTANRAVHAYNAARGVYLGGVRFYGAFLDSQDVPLDLAMAAIVACDEDVTLKAGGTEPRYHGGLEWEVTRPVRDFFKVCSEGMAGHIGTRGHVAIYAGVSQTPIFTFSDADCVRGGDQEYRPMQSFGSLRNQVTAKFLDVTQVGFPTVDAPPRASNDDLDADGGIPLIDSLNLDHVQSGPTCQRIMEITRKKHRAQSTAVRTFFPTALNAQEGQWIAGTSSAWPGTKWWQIEHVKVDRALRTVRLELREIPSDLDDWNPATDELSGYSVNLPSGVPPDPLALTGITAAPLSELGDDGSSLPGFVVTFDPVDDPSVDSVWIRWRLLGDTVEYILSIPKSEVVNGSFSVRGLAGETSYQYSLLVRGIPGRADAEWTDWVTVTTPASKVGSGAVDQAALSADLLAFADFVAAGARSSFDEARSIAQAAAEGILGAAEDTQQLSQNVYSLYLSKQVASDTYLTAAAAGSTYLSISNAASTYLSQSSATTTYLSKTDASSTYLTSATAASTYLTTSSASSTYLSQSSASTTYLTQAAGLTAATAAITYLTTSSASSTYLSQSSASATYLTQSNASSTYLTASAASSTYLSTTNAASTYLSLSTASATYLTQSNASGTYLTQSSASATYLTTASATSTYATISTTNSITSLLGNVSATGYWATKTVASVDGAAVSVEMGATLTQGGALGTGAVGVDVFSDGTSRVRLKGSQIVFQNPAGTIVSAFDTTTGLLNANALLPGAATPALVSYDITSRALSINTLTTILTPSAFAFGIKGRERPVYIGVTLVVNNSDGATHYLTVSLADGSLGYHTLNRLLSNNYGTSQTITCVSGQTMYQLMFTDYPTGKQHSGVDIWYGTETATYTVNAKSDSSYLTVLGVSEVVVQPIN